MKCPNKQCELDPLPVWLLKKCLDLLAPYVTLLVNKSLSEGVMPSCMKQAIVTPILKKRNADHTDLSNYRPVSNLSFLSKLIEKVVSHQLTEYLECNALFPVCQSAYRANHSTETALLRVYSDLVTESDAGNISILALLDLSAAFDTVDYDILIQRLVSEFGFDGMVITWISSYLSDRRQSVRYQNVLSSAHTLTCGVPQGSVLGPLLFVLYTAGLHNVIDNHGLRSHFYADDSQIYASCKPKDSKSLKTNVLQCINDVSSWMSSNRLKLNPTKTEFMWCSTPSQRHLINDEPFDVAGISIKPVSSVKLLGVFIDGDLSMSTQVNKTISSCFYQLRRIKSVRRSLPMEAAKTVVNAFVVSRVDYCNGLLAGITQKQLDRLQSILNASAKLLYGGTGRDHVTPLLRDKLHWLWFTKRITYKLCLTAYKALHELAPAYITELIQTVASNPQGRRLRSAATGQVCNPGSKKKFGERVFAVAALSAWNKLPVQIHMSQSLSSFKEQLKTGLFTKSYPM